MGEKEDESFLSVMSMKKWPFMLGDSRLVDALKKMYFQQKRHIEVPESKCRVNRIRDALVSQEQT